VKCKISVGGRAQYGITLSIKVGDI